MKERPILFQGAMIRALLAGTKTQTRRAVKPQPHPDAQVGGVYGGGPYGEPGDRLWVRESWGYFDPDGSGEDYDSDRNDDGGSGPCKVYAPEMLQEGHPLREFWRRRVAYKATFAEQKYGMGPVGPAKWRPSIHMPRWASRITLEVTGVRVERLQDISYEDAQAEGCPCYVCGRTMDGLSEADCHCFHRRADALDYRLLWEQINGPGSWDANPWVWAVSFKPVTPPSPLIPWRKK